MSNLEWSWNEQEEKAKPNLFEIKEGYVESFL